MSECKGLIHLYTGDGKGKTTAAIGLSVRAAGAGKKVVFSQFMKGRDTSELKSLCNIPGITIVRNNIDLGWFRKDDQQQIESYTKAHNEILSEIETLIMNGQCDVLVLDEVTYPYNYGIIDKDRLKALIKDKPEDMEIVLTGRNAPDFMTEAADYITQMQKVKHPYDNGVEARIGIEY
ncbi:cob(I)yrinic acid a,c-diamide adenosyltransferase [Butyrivibrio sp. VCB2006]|uniref:cob(I)yrinic acid a,c-diamide adenosyltransferase n=1 Tax=Butyrivibrio sp. VCB2006 TaxID=1280679 RepID=UPI000422B4BD|nr:cob(I)yrinic acid a,c-diamide adenosyltransferase [Butyrivibrio sp. VCB2006]